LQDAKLMQDDEQNPLAEIGVVVRVINGWLEHYHYASHPGECLPFKVNVNEKNAFVRYKLDLKDKGKWVRFDSDGNHLHGPHTKDFQIISSVIFEVGGYKELSRPGSGKGMIDFKDIRLSDK
jgi:hypothetical protein